MWLGRRDRPHASTVASAHTGLGASQQRLHVRASPRSGLLGKRSTQIVRAARTGRPGRN
jgi:hypothetical protein